MTLTPDQQAAYEQAAEFNRQYPPGTPVLAWPGTRDDEPLHTRTRYGAWPMGGGDTAVVSVFDYPGGIALTHIEHDPTRQPAVPDIAFESPPCPMCDRSLGTDGDSFTCDHCHATWNTNGSDGEWDDPAAARCPATARRYTTINPDETMQCALAAGHAAERHVNAEGAWNTWDDSDPRALVDGDGEAVSP